MTAAMLADTASPDTRQPAKDAAIGRTDGTESAAPAAWLALAVLVVATVVGAVDRQLLVLMAEPLKLSLDLSDTQLGLLQGVGVALLAGLAAFPIGWLADRYDRRLVLVVCVLLWSLSTAACGLSQSFDQLMLAAMGLGLGEAGLVPIVYGLVPDLFPKRQRMLANAVYGIAAVFGSGIGIALSGELLSMADKVRGHLPMPLQGLEGWRIAFLVAAALGPATALAIALLRLRRRVAYTAHAAHAKDAADATDATHDGSKAAAAPAFLPYLKAHSRALTGIFAGIGAGSLGMSALATWLPVIAARSFGASASDTGRAMGSAFAIGTVVGGLIGAGLSRMLKGQGVAALVRVLWVAIGLAGLATLAMPLMPGLAGLFTLFGLQVAALFVGSVIYPSLVQLISPAELRSRTLALNAAIVALLTAASPVAVGMLSDRIGGSGSPLLMAVVIVTASAMVLGAVVLQRCEAAVLRSAREVDA